MPKKTTKKKAGKTALRKTAAKSVKRTAKKKVLKKTAGKKAVTKKVLKTKTAKKKAAPARTPAKKKAAPKKTAITSQPKLSIKKNIIVLPGPQPAEMPPVEEPSSNEEALGVITHYYSHLGVAVVQLNKGTLRSGNQIHVKGHVTDLMQTVDSMEYEHRHIDEASAGQSVGLKVTDHVREHDIVYLVK